jgi:hypothetical protein
MSRFPIDLRALQLAALWLFLLPLIIILGTADILSGGRSRNWPFPSSQRVG